MTERVRKAVRVEGIVQGVGFRPFVYGLATGLSLGGLVGNDPDGVFAEVEGTKTAVGQFLDRLARDAPPLARVDRVRTWGLPLAGSARFTIVASQAGDPDAGRRALVSPDTAPCADCLRELADPADRRFGYPFINCTNCGPRYTIVRDVPYDRARTTMAPVHHVRRLRGRVPRPGQPPVPRRTNLLCRLRADAGPDQPGRCAAGLGGARW